MMVVVVVIAILAAIALPSYSEAVAKSRRTEAKRLLTTIQADLERCFTVNSDYRHSTSLPCPAADSISGAKSQTSEHAFYSISVGAGSTLLRSSYTLVAVRQGAQSSDRCGDFSLSSTDVKAIANQKTGVKVDDCW